MAETKILFIPRISENPVTGGEIYNKKLVNFLNEKYDVRNFSYEFMRFQAKSLHKILLFSAFSVIRNILYFFKIVLFTRKPVIVFEDIYYSTDLFLFNYLVSSLRLKSIVTIPITHLFYYSTKKASFQKEIFYKIEKILIDNSTFILCNSNYSEAIVKSMDFENSKKIIFAPPGVDIKEKRIYREIGEHVNLLYMGSLVERKDLITVLKALIILNPMFFLHVVGDTQKEPDYTNSVLTFIKENNLERRVQIHGFLDQRALDELFANIDIFVFPSQYESFGMVLIEAMENGFPIVATDIEATRQLIEHEYNGLLVPPRDHEEMAKSIMSLISEEGLIEKLVQNGYITSRKYSWEHSFATLGDVIDNLGSY